MAAGDTDERDLIEAAKVDPASFAELYERNFDRVRAFVIRRVSDRTEAEDITSEVFHDALRGIGKFEWRGTPYRGDARQRRGEFGAMPAMMYMIVADADITVQRAVAAGARVISDPAAQSYGVRMGAVQDEFGNQWYLAGPAK